MSADDASRRGTAKADDASRRGAAPPFVHIGNIRGLASAALGSEISGADDASRRVESESRKNASPFCLLSGGR